MGEMAQFEDVEVPFIKIGNRRALTGLQIMQEPWLKEFIERFPASFEFCINQDCAFFIEPEAKSYV